MKNVLFITHNDPGQEARLQFALDLVRTVGGHLTCLDTAALPIVVDGNGTARLPAFVVPGDVLDERSCRAELEPRIAMEGIPYNWFDVTGGIVDAINTNARLNDIVVVGTHASSDRSGLNDFIASIVITAGRPVLTIPDTVRSPKPFATALVAWDGSDPAEAALSAALPLLRLGERAVIATIGPTEAGRGGHVAASYCVCNGVRAEVERLPAGFDKPWRTLLDYADLIGAQCIVMGAVGRSKLHDHEFGSLAQHVIEQGSLPLFLAR